MSEIVLIVEPRTETVEVTDGGTTVFDTKTETIVVVRETELAGEQTIVFDIESETIIVTGDEVRVFDMRTEVIEIHDGGPATTAIFQGPGASGLVPDPITSTGRFLRDDGTWGSGGGGGGGPTYVEGEEPAGTINGINAVFTLLQSPSPISSLHLFKSGLRMKRGAGKDFTISANMITFESDAIPKPGMELLADYQI